MFSDDGYSAAPAADSHDQTLHLIEQGGFSGRKSGFAAQTEDVLPESGKVGIVYHKKMLPVKIADRKFFFWRQGIVSAHQARITSAATDSHRNMENCLSVMTTNTSIHI